MAAAPPRSGLGNARALFRAPGFPRIWTGAVLFTLGQWTERVALGWFVFDQTDSAFITAAATAAQAAPGIFIGPVAGSVSDRSRRPLILASAASLKAVVMLVVAVLVFLDRAPVAAILPLVAVSGVGLSFHLSSLHTLSGDLVGAERRASAISVVSTGQRTVAAAGALASGLVIGLFGASWSFGVGAVALALAALVYRGVPEPRVSQRHATVSFLADTTEGLRIVRRVRMVAILLGLMVVVEIFGFSYMALLPALADRVLGVGAAGLGGLSAAAGIGSIGGTLFLTAHGDRARKGPLFIGVLLAFGLLMGLLGVSGWYVLALIAAGGIGACAAMVDALEWIMLQASVDDRLRGRVLGAWNVAIGFGWIGPLLLGAIADATDVGLAFAIAGAVLGATALLAAALSPRLRAA